MRDVGLRRGWTFGRWIGAAVLAFVLGAGAHPAAAESTPPATPAKKAVKYTPRDWGAPKTRVAAAARGLGRDGPYLTLLVPEQTGHTSEASPTLYWYVSEPFRGPVKATLMNEEQADPVLELQLDGGVEAGFHALPLGERDVALRTGVEYEWSVALVVDPDQPSGDIFASGTIRRAAPPAKLPAGGDDVDRLVALAGQGLWYDAIDLAGQHLAARPQDATWRGMRAALLEQQGLAEPAARDRSLAGLQ
jgi:Domain of Unknown Function (DUF928)